MSKVWIIARHEYLTNLRRTGFIIGLIGVPLLGLLALLVGAFFSGQASGFLEQQFSSAHQQVGVVDQVGAFSPILPAYRERFHLYPDEPSGAADILAGRVALLLVIPPDYVSTGNVKVVAKGSDFSAVGTREWRPFFVDHLLRDMVDVSLRERLAQPYEPVMVAVGDDEQTGQDTLGVVLNTVAGYFFGLLLVITIFTSSTYLLRGVSEEKSSRIIEIILSSVTTQDLLAGKVLGLGALGLTQVVVWLVSAFGLGRAAEALMGISVPFAARPEIFLMGIVYYLLGFVVYAVLTGSVGALGTTMHESQQLAGIFSLMASVPLMLGGMSFANSNQMLLRVLSWFPLTAPTMMLLRFSMADVPLLDVVGSIIVLIITIPVVLLVGARLFRAGLLMYGKRPTLRQVVRVLREA